MAEAQQKRQREETHLENYCEETKRHKSYTQILSILNEEEEEPTQDLSAIFSTFQQELDSSDLDYTLPDPTQETDPVVVTPAARSDCTSSSASTSDPTRESDRDISNEYDEKERVIRHLLEASDDELGIPNTAAGASHGDDEINGGDYSLSFGDGFWEFEDEAANYYTLAANYYTLL